MRDTITNAFKQQLSARTNETSFNECMRDKVEESEPKAFQLKNVQRVLALWMLGMMVALFIVTSEVVCQSLDTTRWKKRVEQSNKPLRKTTLKGLCKGEKRHLRSNIIVKRIIRVQ